MAFQRGSVNKVMLVGNIGNDIEARFTPSGAAVVNLSIATKEVWKSQGQEEQERTEWHKVVLFGKTAEYADKYVKKGQLVFVEGRLQTKKWTDKNEVDHWTTEVIADTFTTLGSLKGGSDSDAPADAVSDQPPDDDDIPF